MSTPSDAAWNARARVARQPFLMGLFLPTLKGAWSLQEIEDEAWHLTFLFPAIKEYLHTGTPEEQDRRKRQMVADNEILLEAAVQPAYQNAKEFVVGRLGQDPVVLYGYEHLDERTRYIFRTIRIEEDYWPAYLHAKTTDETAK